MIRLAAALAALVLATSAWAAPMDWAGTPMRAIQGDPFDGRALEGRVVLVANTASRCAFTPQYEGLEALNARYGGVGLTVLGIPSNDFGGQEPGSNAEIAAFCASTYDVSFPMLEKSPVTGDAAHPVFAWAAREGGSAAVPGWNFHKLLIGRDGSLVASFPTFTPPDSLEVRAAIERALATPSF